MTVNSVEDVTRSADGRRSVWAAAAALITAATVLAYLPGLAGPFVFDDFGSLSRLGDLGGIRDWATFKAFVLSGDAGPTGRPLALVTFVLDGTTWPTDPAPFKRTNLIIHLMTGAMLFLCARQILSYESFTADRATRVALLATALWLLHPFLVSTTLYAVQRMAQLATLFVLAGLAAYLYGRRLLATRPTRGYLLMTAGVGLGTLLATLSKENGILLPLLVLLTEATIVAAATDRYGRLNPVWKLTFLWAPVALVLAYLANYVNNATLHAVNLARGYSIYERLLSETRILIDYLWHWFVPVATTTGVFQDHLTHSTGLLEPMTTLASVLFHALVISGALVFRRRQPLVSYALLFFYCAHLLESSVINLELYFEHRNYLAAAFLFLPVVAFMDNALERRVFVAISAVLAMVFAGITATTTYGWRSYPAMIETAAKRLPDSMRAQQQYALQLYNSGAQDRGLEVIRAAVERKPDNLGVQLTRTLMHCQHGTLNTAEFETFAERFGRQPYDPRLLGAYETLFDMVVRDVCPAISPDDLYRFFEQSSRTPANANTNSVAYFQVQYFLGMAALVLDRTSDAVVHFQASLRSRPTASRAMLMASLLAGAEAYDEAFSFTDMALRQTEAGDARVAREEIEAFRARLRDARLSTDDSDPER
ncbi:MAG: hypothetical protein AAGA61_01610 [Pseudomonadota bacterium]